MDRLTRITLKGYRSIKAMDLELRPLNILIGANGAGKSNLISFFKMLNELIGGRLQQYLGTSGRAQSLLYFGPKVTPQLEAKLEFEALNGEDTYSMRLFYASGDTLVFAEETLRFKDQRHLNPKEISLGAGHPETRIGEKADSGEPLAKVFWHLLGQCRVYHFHDTSATAPIRQYSYLGEDRFLRPDAGNLATMLYTYQKSSPMVYKRMEATIRKVMPEFDTFVLEPDRINPRDILLNWRRKGVDYTFGPHQFSDGSIRAIAIITLFLQPENDLPKVIIMDEPELGLHPYALEIVAGLIRAASVRTQVIVATQSPAFLDHFNPADILVVESNGEGSQYRRLDPGILQEWLEDYSIGDLWQRNVLGGGPMP